MSYKVSILGDHAPVDIVLSLKINKGAYFAPHCRIYHLSRPCADFCANMCESSSINTTPPSYFCSKYSGINQPHKIHRFDASLNELTELNEVGIKAFTNLKVLDVSLNRISS